MINNLTFLIQKNQPKTHQITGGLFVSIWSDTKAELLISIDSEWFMRFWKFSVFVVFYLVQLFIRQVSIWYFIWYFLIFFLFCSDKVLKSAVEILLNVLRKARILLLFVIVENMDDPSITTLIDTSLCTLFLQLFSFLFRLLRHFKDRIYTILVKNTHYDFTLFYIIKL